MDAKDLPGDLFVAGFRYPKVARRALPHVELNTETRETDEPFRLGYGVAVRIPLTRYALVLGEWVDDLPGETYEEKIRSALKGHEPDIDVGTIKEW